MKAGEDMFDFFSGNKFAKLKKTTIRIKKWWRFAWKNFSRRKGQNLFDNTFTLLTVMVVVMILLFLYQVSARGCFIGRS